MTMSDASLMAHAIDRDGNHWTLAIAQDGSIQLIYHLEKIASLDATEGSSLLEGDTDGADRLNSILSRLEQQDIEIYPSVRSQLAADAGPWVQANW